MRGMSLGTEGGVSLLFRMDRSCFGEGGEYNRRVSLVVCLCVLTKVLDLCKL